MVKSTNSIFNQNQDLHQTLRVSVDKLSFTVPKRYFFKDYYKKEIPGLAITVHGKYNYRLHINAEYITSSTALIIQIWSVFLELFIQKVLRVFSFIDFITLMTETISTAELEIAFDMPKTRFNFDIIKQYFKPEQNTYYSQDFINRNSKSRISIYNRDLKLGNKVINRSPTYRLEFRLMPRDISKIVIGKNKKIENCAFLYQKSTDLLNNMENPLRDIRNMLGIPREILHTYRDIPLLDRIFS